MLKRIIESRSSLKKNNGLGHARNTGLNHATGDYVLFVDSDDFLTDNSLDELYYNAISNDSDIVIFNFNNYNDRKNIYKHDGFQLENVFEDVDFNNFTFTYKHINLVMYDYLQYGLNYTKKTF